MAPCSPNCAAALRRASGLLSALAVMILALTLSATGAQAARVLVLGPGGREAIRDDPFVTMAPVTGTPSAARAQAAPARHPKHGRTVRSELARLRRTGAITATDYGRYSASFAAALRALSRLNGTRWTELEAVIANLHEIAAAGLLTPSRLPALFETLDRNREWWASGSQLSPNQQVEFSDSQLVWEYYPGQGIELQVLGSFGKADGLYTAGPAYFPQMRQLLAELIPLAARRGAGLAWEYYFHFAGGAPPWTSAMSQGTALEALSRAFKAFGDSSYLDLAQNVLPSFTASSPVGVAFGTPLGARYLLYSFAPRAAVLNGFLQALIGLYDYAQTSGNQQAAQLFASGDAEARAEVPRYDTGAWSLYEPGKEDTLDYHNLVIGFLQQLCARTQAPAYCVAAEHFQAYLMTPPTLQLITHHARRGTRPTVNFWLSKYSHVGIVVTRGERQVFLTSAYFGYGVGGFVLPPLKRAGQYTIRLAATDLAGNFNRIIDTLVVS